MSDLRTHYVGDGCEPPHDDLSPAPSPRGDAAAPETRDPRVGAQGSRNCLADLDETVDQEHAKHSTAEPRGDAAPAPDDNLRSRLAESEAQVVTERARAEAAERERDEWEMRHDWERERRIAIAAAFKVADGGQFINDVAERADRAEDALRRCHDVLEAVRGMVKIGGIDAALAAARAVLAGVPGERTPQQKLISQSASAPGGTVAPSASDAGCDGTERDLHFTPCPKCRGPVGACACPTAYRAPGTSQPVADTDNAPVPGGTEAHAKPASSVAAPPQEEP